VPKPPLNKGGFYLLKTTIAYFNRLTYQKKPGFPGFYDNFILFSKRFISESAPMAMRTFFYPQLEERQWQSNLFRILRGYPIQKWNVRPVFCGKFY
jgi:hypothetical protein